MRFLLHICVVASLTVIAPAFAEEDEFLTEGPIAAAEATPPIVAAETPPGRVGRISLVSGNVNLRVSGETGWADAELNQPIFTGEAVRTDPRSRAEIRSGADTIDLSDSTELDIADLGDQVTQIAVLSGRVEIHLRQIGQGESVEIDTPRGGVWLLEAGDYDIDVGSGEQPLRVAVFAGSARFAGGDAETGIGAGDVAVLQGSTNSGPITVTIEAAAPDPFVEWCRARDYDKARLVAPYYISSDMTGFAELDAAGSWKVTSQYGPIWIPTGVPEDWAPYRDGHWSWIAAWGWTWIDDQSWGFAPYHYGRWILTDQRWAWVPGSFAAHPLYMPAVVAFLGTPGVGLSFADGAAIGWFPLAPGEVYWPSYTSDLNYVRSLNLANVGDAETIRLGADGEPPLEVFDKDYANRQFASVVPRPVFINGRPVAPALISLPEQRLRNAPVLMGSPQIAPPSAQPSARATTATVQTGRKKALPSRLALAISRGGGVKPVRAVATPPRGRGQPVIIRGAHLHAPSYAGLSRGRHLIVLRVAHIAHGAGGKGHRG